MPEQFAAMMNIAILIDQSASDRPFTASQDPLTACHGLAKAIAKVRIAYLEVLLLKWRASSFQEQGPTTTILPI